MADELEHLKIREERLRTIVESAPACLARITRDGTILAMNTAARSMLGAAHGRDVLKKSLLSFVAADDRERARTLIEGACGGQAASLEIAINGLANTARKVEASAVALPARDDAAATALMAFRDITGRRRLENSVVESGAARAAAMAQAAQVDELERRVAELDGQYQQIEEDRGRLTAANQQLQGEIDQLKAREHEFARLAAERDELQRQLAERPKTIAIETDGSGADAPTHGPRLADIEAECGRLAAERDRLLASAGDARAEMRALDARLEAQAATHQAMAAEREELKRALEVSKAEHAAETAAAFAERAALERRLHDAEALLEQVRREHAADLATRADAYQALRAQLEATDRARAQAAAERDAAASVLQESQQYEKAARRWMTQWSEMEQALQTARSEFQQLTDWARARNERLASPDAAIAAARPVAAGNGLRS